MAEKTVWYFVDDESHNRTKVKVEDWGGSDDPEEIGRQVMEHHFWSNSPDYPREADFSLCAGPEDDPWAKVTVEVEMAPYFRVITHERLDGGGK